MPRRRQWEIVEHKDGTWEVSLNRRVVLPQTSETEAWRHIKQNLSTGDRVYEVEEDGYRIDVTRSLARVR